LNDLTVPKKLAVALYRFPCKKCFPWIACWVFCQTFGGSSSVIRAFELFIHWHWEGKAREQRQQNV
jgi:hypothetical protein